MPKGIGYSSSRPKVKTKKVRMDKPERPKMGVKPHKTKGDKLFKAAVTGAVALTPAGRIAKTAQAASRAGKVVKAAKTVKSVNKRTAGKSIAEAGKMLKKREVKRLEGLATKGHLTPLEKLSKEGYIRVNNMAITKGAGEFKKFVKKAPKRKRKLTEFTKYVGKKKKRGKR